MQNSSIVTRSWCFASLQHIHRTALPSVCSACRLAKWKVCSCLSAASFLLDSCCMFSFLRHGPAVLIQGGERTSGRFQLIATSPMFWGVPLLFTVGICQETITLHFRFSGRFHKLSQFQQIFVSLQWKTAHKQCRRGNRLRRGSFHGWMNPMFGGKKTRLPNVKYYIHEALRENSRCSIKNGSNFFFVLVVITKKKSLLAEQN